MYSMRSNVLVFVEVGLLEFAGFSEAYSQRVEDFGLDLDKVLFKNGMCFDYIDWSHCIGYDESIDFGLEQCEFLDVRGLEKKFLNLSWKSNSVSDCFENLNITVRAAHGESVHVVLVDVESDEAILMNIFQESFPWSQRHVSGVYFDPIFTLIRGIVGHSPDFRIINPDRKCLGCFDLRNEVR